MINFRTVAAQLAELTSKDYSPTLLSLTKKQLIAFEELKLRLTQRPILHLPKANVHCTVDTAASAGQIGCVLVQEHEKKKHPIGYLIRTLTSAEQNYLATEREGLAVLRALSLSRPYLERQHFTVYTDQQALRFLLHLSDAELHSRLARWRLGLAEFNFTVV